MKRLLLLLCALLVTFALSSSPLFAASKSIEYRIQSILSIIWQDLFPLSGFYFAPEESELIYGGGSDSILGGDADDYANGKISPPPDSQKPGGRLESGPNAQPRELTRGTKSAVR